jgi:hypothetical protein
MIAIEKDERERPLDFHVRLLENVKHFSCFFQQSLLEKKARENISIQTNCMNPVGF